MRWTEEKTRELLQKALKMSKADQTEVSFEAKNYGLTRFAGNVIHQNMAEEDCCLTIRVADGKRLGAAGTNQLDDESLKATAASALEIARLSKPVDLFAGFAEKMPIEPIAAPVYIQETAQAGPQERANLASRLIRKADVSGFEAAGSISTGTYSSAVATSLGQFAHQLDTRCYGLTVINRPGQTGFGSGYAEMFERDAQKIDPEQLAEQAVRISAANHDAVSLPAGDYEAILTPAAVGLLIYYLTWMAFHAKAVQSGQSFLTNRFGEQVLDEKLSISDDVLNGRNFGMPFDWEGYPRQRVDIIQNGVALDVVYDSLTAKRAGRKSTGHALSLQRDRYYSSPMAENIIVAPGDSSLEEMIANTKRGVFINRLWYVREVDFKTAMVTGMSRDGSFLVENGKITKALRNLRFSQSLSQAFSNIERIGQDRRLTECAMGAYFVPSMKLRRFSIDGSSTF